MGRVGVGRAGEGLIRKRGRPTRQKKKRKILFSCSRGDRSRKSLLSEAAAAAAAVTVWKMRE